MQPVGSALQMQVRPAVALLTAGKPARAAQLAAEAGILVHARSHGIGYRMTVALIQQGARLTQRADDVLFEMKEQLRGFLREEWLAEGESVTETLPAVKLGGLVPEAIGPGALSAEERHVFELVEHEPVHYDMLLDRIDQSQVKPARLPAVLLSLELKQAVRQMPGKLYAVVR